MSPHCPYVPLGLKDGTELGQKPTEGTPWDCNIHSPLLGALPWDSWESKIPPGQSMAILDNPHFSGAYILRYNR